MSALLDPVGRFVTRMRRPLLILVAAMFLAGCSAGRVPDIKQHASEVWARIGMEIVGYEGYNYGSGGTWGGCVWYTLKRVPDNGELYTGCITKWGDEYHIYSLRAYDAISPRRAP